MQRGGQCREFASKIGSRTRLASGFATIIFDDGYHTQDHQLDLGLPAASGVNTGGVADGLYCAHNLFSSLCLR